MAAASHSSPARSERHSSGIDGAMDEELNGWTTELNERMYGSKGAYRADRVCCCCLSFCRLPLPGVFSITVACAVTYSALAALSIV